MFSVNEKITQPKNSFYVPSVLVFYNFVITIDRNFLKHYWPTVCLH